MFYCDPCAAEREWPVTMFKSQGRCEICRRSAVCNDTPSSRLPLPKNCVECGYRRPAHSPTCTVPGVLKSLNLDTNGDPLPPAMPAKDPACTCITSGPDVEGPSEDCSVHGRFRPGDWVLVYARVQRGSGHPDDMVLRLESHNEDYTACVRLDRVLTTEQPAWAKTCTAMAANDDGRYVRCKALVGHAGWHTSGERQWDHKTTVGHIEET